MKPIACIGFAEALSAPEVAWSLRDAGFDVHAFGRRDRRSPLRHSNSATVIDVTAPEVDISATIGELAALLSHFGSDTAAQRVFFPLDDASLHVSTRLSLPPNWRLVGPSGDPATIALDKTRQTQLALEAGFAVPQTSVADHTADVIARKAELPLILRPAQSVIVANGRIQKGQNWICADETELDRALQQWKEAWPLLVQPFVAGVGEGVFGLATGSGVHAWSGHRRVRMMNPHGSGSSACVSQVVSEETKEHVKSFIARAGWSGLFMVELLRDTKGRIWFVEFNGRPWGSLALSRRQGFEYPAWAACSALGTALPDSSVSAATAPVLCQNAGRELMHLMFLLRGPKSRGLAHWPSFWRTLAAMLWPGLQRKFYNWRRSDPKVFFLDSFYTVRSNLLKSRG